MPFPLNTNSGYYMYSSFGKQQGQPSISRIAGELVNYLSHEGAKEITDECAADPGIFIAH